MVLLSVPPSGAQSMYPTYLPTIPIDMPLLIHETKLTSSKFHKNKLPFLKVA